MMTKTLTEGCQGVLERIRGAFDFLFSEYGAELIHQKDANLEDRCLFVLETSDFRLRFVTEYGNLSLSVGSTDAEPAWSSRPGEPNEWFPLRAISIFLEGRGMPSLEESRAYGREVQQLSREDYDLHLASQLQEVVGQLGEIVSKDMPVSRRAELEAFLTG